MTSRSSAAPQVHVLDPGVATRPQRLTPEKFARRDPASLTEFGHLLETFAVGELMKDASWMAGITSLGHWRTHDHHKVDRVVERDDGAVIGFEVKAATRVAGNDFRGLRKLRDTVGEAFVAGVVLYTGARSYNYEDRLHALPIDRLWTAI